MIGSGPGRGGETIRVSFPFATVPESKAKRTATLDETISRAYFLP